MNTTKDPTELPATICSGLWCVQIKGPDDVLAYETKEECEKVAAGIRRWHAEGKFGRADVMFDPEVIPWPHDAASHAADIEESRRLWNFDAPNAPHERPPT